MNKIAVLGAGSWGTALALLLYDKWKNELSDFSLWEYQPEYAQKLAETRENSIFLPGYQLPDEWQITSHLETAVSNADALIFAVPSFALRGIAHQLNHFEISPNLFINVAKGIENETLMRMSEVLKDELPGRFHNKIASVYGPSHAEEVAQNLPTSVVAASENEAVAEQARDLFFTDFFRVYHSSDIIGVELGGSLKNVVAIAVGIADGLGYGDNTRAAIITRAAVEMKRLGIALGSREETFNGLSGIGDLIVTCTSRHSRNRYVGEQLGKGKQLEAILAEMKMVAEGVKTAQSVHDLSRKLNIEVPICDEVYRILFEQKNPQQAVTDLMLRSPKAEFMS